MRNELKLDIPILMISAISEEDNVREAFRLGASDYISKPFNVGLLKDKVSHLLESKKVFI
jgi:PleD family two-component response regulator